MSRCAGCEQPNCPDHGWNSSARQATVNCQPHWFESSDTCSTCELTMEQIEDLIRSTPRRSAQMGVVVSIEKAFEAIDNVPDEPIQVMISPRLWVVAEAVRQYMMWTAAEAWDEGRQWLAEQGGDVSTLKDPNPYRKPVA